METVKLHIDDKLVEAEKGLSLLEVIDEVDMQLFGKRTIPRLCYHEGLSTSGGCRLCLTEVELKGKNKIRTSCNYEIEDGMNVYTNTEGVVEKRKGSAQLLLSKAPNSDTIKDIAYRLGVKDAGKHASKKPCSLENCVNCGLCKKTCSEIVGVSAITNVKDEKGKRPCGGDACIGCGLCSYVCPTGAIKMEEYDNTRSIWNMEFDLNNIGKYKLTDEQITNMKNFKKDKKSPYKIDIEDDLCKSCERCVTECPQSLFSVSDTFNLKGYRKAEWDKFTIDGQDETLNCAGCEACYDICPESAISIKIEKKYVRLLE